MVGMSIPAKAGIDSSKISKLSYARSFILPAKKTTKIRSALSFKLLIMMCQVPFWSVIAYYGTTQKLTRCYL